MLAAFLGENLFAFFLVFARLGAALMLLPAIGEVYVFVRARLALALAVSAIMTPLLAPHLPTMPESALAMAMLLIGEALMGLFIGSLSRIMISALHTASMVIAFQTGLGAATMFDPNQGDQGAIIGRFLVVTLLALVFTTELHHVLLTALAGSYQTLIPGTLPFVGDFSLVAIRFCSEAFVVAVQIAAPVVLLGLLFYLGLGVLARLMPAVQIFFIALPLQIVLGFWIVMVTLSAMMLWYLDYFEHSFTTLFSAG